MAAIPDRSVEPATPMSLAVRASEPASATSAESILRLFPVAPAFAKQLPRGVTMATVRWGCIELLSFD